MSRIDAQLRAPATATGVLGHDYRAIVRTRHRSRRKRSIKEPRAIEQVGRVRLHLSGEDRIWIDRQSLRRDSRRRWRGTASWAWASLARLPTHTSRRGGVVLSARSRVLNGRRLLPVESVQETARRGGRGLSIGSCQTLASPRSSPARGQGGLPRAPTRLRPARDRFLFCSSGQHRAGQKATRR